MYEILLILLQVIFAFIAGFFIFDFFEKRMLKNQKKLEETLAKLEEILKEKKGE